MSAEVAVFASVPNPEIPNTATPRATRRNRMSAAHPAYRPVAPPPSATPVKFPTTMSGGTQSEGSGQSASTVNPALTSCQKKKSDNASSVSDVRDHTHEFIHASVDEHKTCFTKTTQRMFGMPKVVVERSAEAKEAGAESVLPLQTRVSR